MLFDIDEIIYSACICFLLLSFVMAATTSNPFARVLDANKLSGPEYFSDWELDLKIVLRSEKLTYVLDSPLPLDIAPESTPEERETFQKWTDDDLRVRSLILCSMTPDLKRQ